MMSVSEYEMYIDYPEVDDEEGDYDIWWAIIMLAWEWSNDTFLVLSYSSNYELCRGQCKVL